MKNLFTLLENELAAGRDTMMVTVVAGSGSVPRGAGARMLVGAAGRLAGTIGGGAVEHRAEQLAMEALAQKQSCIRAFTLRRGEVEDLGMVCGGEVRVFIQHIPATGENLAFAARVAASADGGANAWLLCDITSETAWQMALYVEGGGLVAAGRAPGGEAAGLEQLDAEALQKLLLSAPVQRETAGGRLVYAEPVAFAARVLVFGGGACLPGAGAVTEPGGLPLRGVR
ncbi:XdhC family protein [Ruminococcaceae bacterium OttesenSCG-928-D13]|nr:XdhC family protein [Ruminococcaceae bacterium OttesenSCG-928-D13]